MSSSVVENFIFPLLVGIILLIISRYVDSKN